MFRENIDFKFVNIEDSEITAIELLLDDFKGVLYHYHKARIVEDGDVARLQFGYTILEPGNHDIDELNSKTEFHMIMGDILGIILMSRARENESSGNDNTEKFDLQ